MDSIMTGLPPEARTGAAGEGRLLAFRAGGEEYALPIDGLVEVIRYREPTPVPGAEAAVDGILAHRGRMITLIDLRRRLGLTARPAGAAAQVIVASVDGEWLGLVVDLVVRVVSGHDRVLRPATLVGVAA